MSRGTTIPSIWTVQSPQAGVVRVASSLNKALEYMGMLIRQNGQMFRDEYFVREHFHTEFKDQDEYKRWRRAARSKSGRI